MLEGLGSGVKPQVLMTTHAPLVLASLEPHFREDEDKQFLFELKDGEVSLLELPWAKHGSVASWLASTFAIDQDRSVEAERAIEAAYALIGGDTKALTHEGLRTADEIEHELKRVLADHDPFLIDWYGWRKHGIHLNDPR